MGNFGRGLLVLVGLLLLIALAKARKSSETSKRPTETPPRASEKPKELKAFPKELLPKYEPLEFLGEGGFAKVFKVKRKSDGKIIALKIPRIDERTSKTFIKEVSTWLHLNHPNIVKLYDVDILPVPYLEMEYVEGVKVGGKTIRDLDKYPKPVDEGTALKLIKGIAEGLRYAHEKGVYHRDLKPLNILLKSDLTPKITDWGLAKVGTMSSSRSVLGYTPLYAAPEHLMPGKYGHTDARTDIWQLGVTFYELLTGKPPFEGYTYEEIFGKIVDESYKFTPPSKINPQLAKYDGIFEKLLAKRKEERYQSVDDFLRDLKELEAEKRKAELEREVEELKKSLKRSVEALKRSKSAEETLKNRRLVVETLGKLALAYAQLNRKAELLNTLNDLKFYTVQNLTDLTNAISTVEMMIRENVPVGDDFMERLKVLVHNIRRENEV
ncbi:MAG TPA: serine/threonine protein kinase [Thermococcus paralvinellae]|uniref:Serine/threonine protein kinase n=1 Tax=Thermococcus paralvinellae TaxID=582419 RepID=A0A832Z9W8_9EURY|nr:serine/threonine protein kinase [Thermococcus paralvinellae]